jgi:hypothetical protein
MLQRNPPWVHNEDKKPGKKIGINESAEKDKDKDV